MVQTTACAANPVRRVTAHLATIAVTLGVHSAAWAEPNSAHEDQTSTAYQANAFELFLGATVFERIMDPSIGVFYERRIGEVFGIGPMVEFTVDSDHREWVLAVPLLFHASEHWKAILAPGAEINNGEATYLTRIGAAYDVDLGSIGVSPELNFDFVDGDIKTVIGVSVGWQF